MIVKLLTEHHLEFLSLKGGRRGSSESTLVKMSNCWKSHAAAQLLLYQIYKMDMAEPKHLHIRLSLAEWLNQRRIRQKSVKPVKHRVATVCVRVCIAGKDAVHSTVSKSTIDLCSPSLS